LRVAFNCDSQNAACPGGGEVQFDKTAEYLKRRGVEIRTGSWSAVGCDLLHIFGTTPAGLEAARAAKRINIPVALSTISWYDPRVSWRLEPTQWRRIRSITGWSLRRAVPAIPSWRRELLTLCDLLLPNSLAEAQQLVQLFGVAPSRVKVVRNAVDLQFECGDAALFERYFSLNDFVLVPGRIEPRKNQLNLLRALWGSGIPVVVLGDPHPDHRDYAAECMRVADAGTTFIGRLEHGSPMLAAAYAAARVVVLASWFETPGLAALEGALAGAEVVVTEGGSAREYFGDLARYLSPDDPWSIRRAVREAFECSQRGRLTDLVRTRFLWEQAAIDTLSAYSALVHRVPPVQTGDDIVAAAA
jgi:glycosyltransferase involved in cell wall biosynthesis